MRCVALAITDDWGCLAAIVDLNILVIALYVPFGFHLMRGDTGSIPSTLADMSTLVWLDLSSNQLWGEMCCVGRDHWTSVDVLLAIVSQESMCDESDEWITL